MLLVDLATMKDSQEMLKYYLLKENVSFTNKIGKG